MLFDLFYLCNKIFYYLDDYQWGWWGQRRSNWLHRVLQNDAPLNKIMEVSYVLSAQCSLLTSMIVCEQTNAKRKHTGGGSQHTSTTQQVPLRSRQSVFHFCFPFWWFPSNTTQHLLTSIASHYFRGSNEWEWRSELIQKEERRKICQMQKI